MKFQPDRASDHSIRSYGPGWVMVGNEKIEHSLLLGPDGLRQNWNCQRFEDLRSEHFALVLHLQGVHEYDVDAPIRIYIPTHKLFVFDARDQLVLAPIRRS